MNERKPAVPTTFRGLRILLLDNDTASLLSIAAKLENCSYKVTTTELPTIALSILQERADSLDVVMADMEMQEMDCFEFINSIQLIKDLPIILMSAESSKNVVEEAIIKGACFFLKKPISSKNLMNVWQHFYRKTKHKNGRIQGKEKVVEIVNGEASNEPENEQVGENGRGGQIGGTKMGKSIGLKRKKPVSPLNDGGGENKRRRTDENQVFADSPKYQASLFKLLQETDSIDMQTWSENSYWQSKFEVKKKDLETELASSYSTNKEQVQARVESDATIQLTESGSFSVKIQSKRN